MTSTSSANASNPKIRSLIQLLMALSGLFSLLQYLRPYGWVFALIGHFPLQYFIVCLLGGSVLLVQKRFTLGALFLALSLLNTPFLIPYWLHPPVQTTPSGEPLKILHFNLFRENPNYHGVVQFIESRNPHILTINEFTHTWHRVFIQHKLYKRYPHCLQAKRYKETLLLCSRLPMQATWTRHPSSHTYPSIKGTILWHGQPVTVAALHTVTPITPGRYKLQQDHIRQTIRWLKSHRQQHHLIVLGDLNMTPWTPAFKQLLAGLNLKDTQLDSGLQPSWPIVLPVALIPIDHVLISPSLDTLKRQTGPFIWSDHLPVYVEVIIPPRSSTVSPSPTLRPEKP